MTTTRAEAVVVDLKATLLKACSGGGLGPCWVNAYHLDSGTIRGVDVSGLSPVLVARIPGNVLAPGSWQVGRFIDEQATDEQMTALPDACRGTLDGPLVAELAGLIGEELAVERAPIVQEIRDAVQADYRICYTAN